MPEPLPVIALKKSTIKKIVDDPEAAAKAAKLVYVNCSEEGIMRIRTGKSFSFRYRGKTVKDKEDLQRIHSLVLPPAWEDVWICHKANGHIQATGKDVRGRKQYKYHALWNQLRNQTKFFKLLELGKLLPTIRKQVQKDLSLEGLPKNKVLAVVISLMEKTGIRVGNEFYEKLYGSFGLTTLKDKHVDIKKNKLKFCFRGKKGVEHTVTLNSKKLARIVLQCRDIPGKELFQYIDEEGSRQTIDSGMVNDYLRDIISETGPNPDAEFTAKDFRTWCGTVTALNAFIECGPCSDEKQVKKNVTEMFDKVAEVLGNTRTVTKKYYVHPSLPELYENGKLTRLIKKNHVKVEGLQEDEELLMQVLESL
jgi:DNA topoisomerase I